MNSSNELGAIFDSYNLQLLLLVGSGILAISLLALALTRWGHSRPVWKCVFLSFVAHILLMGYAYGTRLMFKPPKIAKQTAVARINLLDGADGAIVDQQADVTETPNAEIRLDEFTTHQASPTIDSLERPELESEIELDVAATKPIEMPEIQPLAMKPASTEIADDDFMASPSEFKTSSPAEIETTPIEVTKRGDDQLELVAPEFDSPIELNEPGESSLAVDPVEAENDFLPPPPSSSFVTELQAQTGDLPITKDVPSLKVADTSSFKPLKPIPPKSKSASQLKVVRSATRLGDGQPLPRIYSLRDPKNRLQVAEKQGGSVETEQAVEMALKWLATNQENDGRWRSSKHGAGRETKVFGHDRGGAGADADCGITGLGTLAFLAAGHTHFEGQYQEEVQKSLEFLAGQQKSNGDLSGDARLFAKMYCHSMALFALSEALAMTGDKRLLPVVQRGVEFSIFSQNRRDGGWRYQPGDAGDMSQFGWQVLALNSAKLGNVRIPDSVFLRMNRFVESCSSGVGGGLASYRPNQGASTTMTAEALLCRFILQDNVGQDTVMAASRRIDRERPTPHHVNLYYWYYGTLAMYHAGGPAWKRWNKDLTKTLLKLQETGGRQAGSWPANGMWGGYGGRVYSTAMATLSLEVYYRYLPMYEQIASGESLIEIR